MPRIMKNIVSGHKRIMAYGKSGVSEPREIPKKPIARINASGARHHASMIQRCKLPLPLEWWSWFILGSG